jgi:hypothetical protein
MSEFLISIGIEGLEAVVDLDELREKDKKVMIEKLSDPAPEKNKYKSELGKVLWALNLRFRMNSHRKIKSYLINYEGSEDDIWAAFKASPKNMKKLIKEKGVEVNF